MTAAEKVNEGDIIRFNVSGCYAIVEKKRCNAIDYREFINTSVGSWAFYTGFRVVTPKGLQRLITEMERERKRAVKELTATYKHDMDEISEKYDRINNIISKRLSNDK